MGRKDIMIVGGEPVELPLLFPLPVRSKTLLIEDDYALGLMTLGQLNFLI